MNRFDDREEKEMYEILDRMTSKNDFWAVENPILEKVGFQRFGLQLREEDFEQEGNSYRGFFVRDRNDVRKASAGYSVVRNDEKEFRVDLDVWPFKRDELFVMLVPGKYITIKGQHERKFEDNSDCTRKFQRYYCLPKGSKSDAIDCSYCNGTLTIRLEKQAVSGESQGPRLVHIDLVSYRNNKDVRFEEQYTPVDPAEVREVPITVDLQDGSETDAETPEEVPITNDSNIDYDALAKYKEDLIKAIMASEDMKCDTVQKAVENLKTANKSLKTDNATVLKHRDSPVESPIDNESSNGNIQVTVDDGK